MNQYNLYFGDKVMVTKAKDKYEAAEQFAITLINQDKKHYVNYVYLLPFIKQA